MSEKTNIAWCDSTVNFWSGCTKVSAGCANCYAEARDARMMQEKVIHWGKGAPRLKHNGAVKSAMAFNRKPWICDGCGNAETHKTPAERFYGCPKCKCLTQHRRRIFSLSLGDWLDEEVPIEWLAEMLDTIRKCDQVVWILCTKRPENFKERLTRVMIFIENIPETKQWTATWKWVLDWVTSLTGVGSPTNIILLTSVENQAMADLRIPQLLAIPAACRGLSLEPLLGPVDLESITDTKRFPGALSLDVLNGREIHHDDNCNWTNGGKINWAIIGGESGSSARWCNVKWVRSLVEQCQLAGVPTFVKQLGADPRHDYDGEMVPISGPLTGKANIKINNGPLRLKDKKGGDINEWPADLRIQEWPNIP